MTGIGDNNPPSALDAEKSGVDAVLEDAEATLTGVVVETEAQDAAVGDLLSRLKATKKAVTEAHKSDKAPWLDGSRRVDAIKIDMIAPLDIAITTAQDCRTPYLQKVERERLEAIRKAQEEADRQEQKLREAHAAKEPASLDIANALEAQEREAKSAKIAAKVAAKPVATGMKTKYTVEIANMEDALNHYFEDGRLQEAMIGFAKSDVRAGKREIPGITITGERTA